MKILNCLLAPLLIIWGQGKFPVLFLFLCSTVLLNIVVNIISVAPSRSDVSQDPMNIIPPPRSQSTTAPPPIPPKAVNNITASAESIASHDTSERSDSGI